MHRRRVHQERARLDRALHRPWRWAAVQPPWVYEVGSGRYGPVREPWGRESLCRTRVYAERSGPGRAVRRTPDVRRGCEALRMQLLPLQPRVPAYL